MYSRQRVAVIHAFVLLEYFTGREDLFLGNPLGLADLPITNNLRLSDQSMLQHTKEVKRSFGILNPPTHAPALMRLQAAIILK